MQEKAAKGLLICRRVSVIHILLLDHSLKVCLNAWYKKAKETGSYQYDSIMDLSKLHFKKQSKKKKLWPFPPPMCTSIFVPAALQHLELLLFVSATGRSLPSVIPRSSSQHSPGSYCTPPCCGSNPWGEP